MNDDETKIIPKHELDKILGRKPCIWYNIVRDSDLKSEEARICMSRCDGYGTIDEKVECQCYYTMKQRKII